jgi:L-ascorbate metabolism protein UlaG (beta-lactamase superfamily)
MTSTASAAPVWQDILRTQVEPGTLTLWWLYQAGFAVKSPQGTVVLVDPYLSDAVVRSYKQPRGVPAPFQADEVAVDAVLATHSHEDHLDPDSVAGFAKTDKTLVIGPRMATQKATSLGIDGTRTVPLARGESTDVGDLHITAVTANHLFGLEPTPDAVGFVISCGGVRVHHSGDTEYDRRIAEDTRGVDAALLCINGTAGNMNVHEAALLAWQQQARMVVPMHHVLWAEGGYGENPTLDPQEFAGTYRRLGGQGEVHIPVPGAPFTVRGR